MIVAKIDIKVEYTSEDGYVYWVVIQRGNRKRKISLGGSDSFNGAVKQVKQYLGIKTVKYR